MKQKLWSWIIAILFLASPAFASELVLNYTSTSVGGVNNSGTAVNNMQQSFILNSTLSKVNITFQVMIYNNTGFPAGALYDWNIYAGETITNSTRLCQVTQATQPINVPAGTNVTVNISFPISSGISAPCILNQSGNYSAGLEIRNEGGGQFYPAASYANPYSNGKCYSCNGATWQPAYDLSFRIYADSAAFGITAYDIYNATYLQNFNATVNGTFYTTTTGNITTGYTMGTGNVSVQVNTSNPVSFFNNQTTSYNTANWNMTLGPTYQANLTTYTEIFVYDYMTGSNLQNFTINYTNNTASGTYYTLSGVIYVPINNANWNITVWNVSNNTKNYTFDTALINATSPAFVRNYTFYVYESNSYNITFHDERNNSVIYSENSTAENTAVDFLGNIHSYSTTINGSGFVSLMIPQNYIIRFYKHNGTTYGRVRQYYVTLTNQTTNNLHLYMIRDVDSDDLTLTVYDASSLQPLKNYVVYLKRFNVTSNAYSTVAMYATDVAGQAFFDVEDQNELYQFQIDYPWGTTVFLSNPLYIESAELNLYINTQANFADLFFNVTNITGIILYSNGTGTPTMSVSYTDTEAKATQYCFQVKTWTRYTKTTVNESCSVANSGTISLTGLTPGKTYYGLFVAQMNGNNETIATGWKDIPSTALGAGRFGIFMAWGIFIVFVFLTSLHFYAAIIGTSSLALSKLLGILPIDWGYVVLIILASIFLTIILHRRR